MQVTERDRARPVGRHLATREHSIAPVRPRAVPSGRSAHPWSHPWRPLSGAALLDRLRSSGRPRPALDGRLAEGLRSLLESRIGPIPGPPTLSVLPDRAVRPSVVTGERLTGALRCAEHAGPPSSGEPGYSIALACGALIGALFRQLVTVGAIGDPMDDGLAALALEEHRAGLLGWIAELSEPGRGELRAEVERQAGDLVRRWPALEASWLPRTRESMRVPIASGAVELVAQVDLAIGRPAEREASVAFVEVSSGARRPSHRAGLHFAALVETLRHGAPPFVVATYYSRTGELDVEPVGAELLVAEARRVATGTGVLLRRAAGIDPGPVSSELCPDCAGSPWAFVPEASTGADPVPWATAC